MQISKQDLILILMGGNNAESEVSIATGSEVLKSLKSMGYNAQELLFDDNFIDNVKKINPKLIFNALHGKFGEDGRVQAILDFLKIPYTHSGVTASAIAMNKIFSNDICSNNITNLYKPKTAIIEKNNHLENVKIIKEFSQPFIIKPIDEGSSAGVLLIKEGDNFNIAQYDWQFGDVIMIQEYIQGQELQIAIMNDRALGVCEIIPEGEFFDYKSKYGNNLTKYIIPANISQGKYQEALDIAVNCHKILNCNGISRVELILSAGKFYFLEINTQPGFTQSSLVPKIAKYVNISFEDMIKYLIDNAKFIDYGNKI